MSKYSGLIPQNVTIAIPAKLIADLMVTAIESGFSKHWCGGVELAGEWSRVPEKLEKPWYSTPRIFAGGSNRLTIVVTEDHGRTCYDHRRNLSDIKDGFAAMAKSHAGVLGLLLAGEFDGSHADLWLQYVTFGKRRYE